MGTALRRQRCRAGSCHRDTVQPSAVSCPLQFGAPSALAYPLMGTAFSWQLDFEFNPWEAFWGVSVSSTPLPLHENRDSKAPRPKLSGCHFLLVMLVKIGQGPAWALGRGQSSCLDVRGHTPFVATGYALWCHLVRR